MSTRAEILAETLARLDVERYRPRPSWSPPEAVAPTGATLPPVTWEEGQDNMRRLLEALGEDDVVVDFHERRAG